MDQLISPNILLADREVGQPTSVLSEDPFVIPQVISKLLLVHQMCGQVDIFQSSLESRPQRACQYRAESPLIMIECLLTIVVVRLDAAGAFSAGAALSFVLAFFLDP